MHSIAATVHIKSQKQNKKNHRREQITLCSIHAHKEKLSFVFDCVHFLFLFGFVLFCAVFLPPPNEQKIIKNCNKSNENNKKSHTCTHITRHRRAVGILTKHTRYASNFCLPRSISCQ